jgi:hypothetical protein
MMKRFAVGGTIAVLIVAFAALLLTVGNSATDVSVSTKHLSSSEVKLSNLAAFEAQVHLDIPLGTPKQAVETYLSREKIPHFFADAGYGDGGNEFYGTLKNIGSRWGFPANLAIRIHLDQKEKVDKVWFRVDYDAP